MAAEAQPAGSSGRPPDDPPLAAEERAEAQAAEAIGDALRPRVDVPRLLADTAASIDRGRLAELEALHEEVRGVAEAYARMGGLVGAERVLEALQMGLEVALGREAATRLVIGVESVEALRERLERLLEVARDAG